MLIINLNFFYNSIQYVLFFGWFITYFYRWNNYTGNLEYLSNIIILFLINIILVEFTKFLFYNS